MRLLHAETLEFHDFYRNPPPYAILSHTWGHDHDEVSYRDIVDSTAHRRLAWNQKVLPCANQAIYDGYKFIWIDTCCIDKSNSVELSEAINSMFRWYQEAEVCYVVLPDLHNPGAEIDNSYEVVFAQSRWFTRGWTLQELLAPKNVLFFAKEWGRIGSRQDMAVALWMITGIEMKYLTGAANVKDASVAERMFWASRRETKRPEDRAYSLLGLFGVSMPPIYGEGGEQAFHRLQEQIIKKIPDDSILAWGYDPLFDSKSAIVDGATSLLAQSPNDFMFCSGFTLREDDDEFTVNPTPTCITNVTTSVFQMVARMTNTRHELGRLWLNCRYGKGGDMRIGTVPIAWKSLGPSPIFYRPLNWSINYSEPRDNIDEMRQIAISVNSHSAYIQPVARSGTFAFEWDTSELKLRYRSPISAWNNSGKSFIFDSGPTIMAVRYLRGDGGGYVVIVISPTRQFNESARWLIMRESEPVSLSTILGCWSEFSRKSQEDSFSFGTSLERELRIESSYIKSESRYILKISPGAQMAHTQAKFSSVNDELQYLRMEREAVSVQAEIDSLQDEKNRILDEREKLGQRMSHRTDRSTTFHFPPPEGVFASFAQQNGM